MLFFGSFNIPLQFGYIFQLPPLENILFKKFSFKNLEIYYQSHLKEEATSFFQVNDDNENVYYVLLGCIYNYECECQNDKLNQFVTDYRQDSIKTLENIKGDFVIFVYDYFKERITIIRDQLGVVPIFYSIKNKGINFCSDELFLTKSLFNFQSLSQEYFLKNFTNVGFYQTMNPKIQRIHAGHFLRMQNEKIQEEKYWFPEKIKVNKKLTFNQLKLDVSKLLESAIKERCNSNLIASTHLSGGLDSALISSLVRKNYKEQSEFIAFSWSPKYLKNEGLEFDEREVIKSLAVELDLIPQFVDERILAKRINQPIHNSLMSSYKEDQHLDFCFAHKIDVIFSGWGGDEFLSIKNNGIELDLIKQFFFFPILKKYQFNFLKFSKHVLKDLLFPFFGIIRKKDLKRLNEDSRYIKKQFIQNDPLFLKNIYTYQSRRDIHLNYLQLGHLQERMEYCYNLGSLKEVTYKYPLLDKDLVEYVLQIPSKLIYNSFKNRYLMLLIAEHYLPAKFLEENIKRDPSIEVFDENVLYHEASKIFSNINIYKNDHFFEFIDFQKIEDDYSLFQVNQNKKEKYADLFLILFLIKNMKKFRNEF